MRQILIIWLLSVGVFCHANGMNHANGIRRLAPLRTYSLPEIPYEPEQFEAWLKIIFNKMDDTEYFSFAFQHILGTLKKPGFFEVYKFFIQSQDENYIKKYMNFLATQKSEIQGSFRFYLDPAFIPFLAIE